MKDDTFRIGGGFRMLREDVSPLRLGEGLAGMILLSLVLVGAVSVAFVVIKHVALWLVPVALLPTLVLGLVLHFWLGLVDRLWGWLVNRAGRLHASFILFFVCLPTFVALYFIILAYPMGMVLSRYLTPELATDYRRWILDVAAVAAMIAWGRLICRKL